MLNPKVLLIYIFLIPLSTFANSDPNAVKLKWFGTTCLSLSDNKTTLLFDPFLTRPSLFEVISFQNLKSDSKIIDKWISPLEMKKVKGVFVTHTHYDHALDLVSVQKKSMSKVYGSNSALKILEGSSLGNFHQKIKAGDIIKKGAFTITVLEGKHPAHFLSFTLAAGAIEKPLANNSTAFGYKMGEVYSFLIEHPLGRIFFHPSGDVVEGIKFRSLGKVDVLIQGIASRVSSTELIEKIINPLNPSIVIPVHYDDFFSPLDSGIKELRAVDLPEFKATYKKLKRGLKLTMPGYGEEIKLL